MNDQEKMNLLKQVLTLLSGIGVGLGVWSASEGSELVGDILVALPAVTGAGSVIWSVYSHWNMKKVPEAARVTLPSGVAGK
jgi:hypothetical protein